MTLLLAVAIGGAIGSLARHLLGAEIGHWLGPGFPYGTLAVNVIGGLVMGLLVELMALKWSAGPEIRAFLTVGLLGGFTTFSAFSLDVVLLTERGDWAAAGAYVAGSVLLSIAALIAGLRLMRAVLA